QVKRLDCDASARKLASEPTLPARWNHNDVIASGGLKIARQTGQHPLRAAGPVGLDQVSDPKTADLLDGIGIHNRSIFPRLTPAVHASKAAASIPEGMWTRVTAHSVASAKTRPSSSVHTRREP